MIIKSLALALALAPAAIGGASADETFYFTFNDSAFNDVGVTETGWVTIADTGLGVGAIRQDTIVNGSVTVSGTVYGPEDWVGGSIVDWSLFPLNLTTQLVGQNEIVVCTFGELAPCGTSGRFQSVPERIRKRRRSSDNIRSLHAADKWRQARAGVAYRIPHRARAFELGVDARGFRRPRPRRLPPGATYGARRLKQTLFRA